MYILQHFSVTSHSHHILYECCIAIIKCRPKESEAHINAQHEQGSEEKESL